MGGDGEAAAVATAAEHHIVQSLDRVANAFRRQLHPFDPESVFDMGQTCERHVADRDVGANAFFSPMNDQSNFQRMLLDAKAAFDLPQAVVLRLHLIHRQREVRLDTAQTVPPRRFGDGVLVQRDLRFRFQRQEPGLGALLESVRNYVYGSINEGTSHNIVLAHKFRSTGNVVPDF